MIASAAIEVVPVPSRARHTISSAQVRSGELNDRIELGPEEGESVCGRAYENRAA